MKNITSSPYMPKNEDHYNKLSIYDQRSDIWLTNITWRFLMNYAFLGASTIASVKATTFFWGTLQFSGLGMLGVGVSMIHLLAGIYKNQGVLFINDYFHSSFGYDYLANDVKKINDFFQFLFSNEKKDTPTTKDINPTTSSGTKRDTLATPPPLQLDQKENLSLTDTNCTETTFEKDDEIIKCQHCGLTRICKTHSKKELSNVDDTTETPTTLGLEYDDTFES